MVCNICILEPSPKPLRQQRQEHRHGQAHAAMPVYICKRCGAEYCYSPDCAGAEV